MGLFDGKKGLILGVANDHSIAWAIAQEIMAGGGLCGFSHLPDRTDDERQRNRRRVAMLTDKEPNAKFLLPMDVAKDDDIRAVVSRAKDEFGQIDFLLHAIAFALIDDLKRDTIDTSREGFKLAMEISAYSLIAVCHAAKDILSPRSSVLTLTYFGGEKAVPGYNVMGICKAALDASVRYLAYDLGPRGTRVNAVSAGPVRTLAGREPASTTCCRSTRKWPPWAATSRTKKSAAPAHSSSPTCPTASPAKFCTSTAATTSWARQEGYSKRTSPRHDVAAVISMPYEVAIAVIEHEGQFLVGPRPSGSFLAGMYEFPGGMVEPGETRVEAVIRECREETGLEIRVGTPFPMVEHEYPHGFHAPVLL